MLFITVYIVHINSCVHTVKFKTLIMPQINRKQNGILCDIFCMCICNLSIIPVIYTIIHFYCWATDV